MTDVRKRNIVFASGIKKKIQINLGQPIRRVRSMAGEILKRLSGESFVFRVIGLFHLQEVQEGWICVRASENPMTEHAELCSAETWEKQKLDRPLQSK